MHYIGENAHWDRYAPPLANHYKKFFFNFYFFFHFRCILLQISHKKCFSISISIPGRSGVKYMFDVIGVYGVEAFTVSSNKEHDNDNDNDLYTQSSVWF